MGYKTIQKGAEMTYKKELGNGLSIFLNIKPDYRILGVSVFTRKELYEGVNADSVPPFRSTSFRLTILAKQTVMLYESIAAPNYAKSFVAVMVSIAKKE